MDSDLVGSNGRTPEEERQYRAENRLTLRTTPPTPEERCRRTLKTGRPPRCGQRLLINQEMNRGGLWFHLR